MEKFPRRFGIAVTLLFVAMLVVWAFNAAKQLSLVTIVVAAGLGMTCLYSLLMMNVSKTVSFQASFDSTGTQLRPDRRIETNLRRVVIAGTLSTWLMFAAWLVGVLYLPFGEFNYVFPLCAFAAAVMFTWSWVKLSTQGSLSHLLLTREGFQFLTLRGPHTARWDEVENIADRVAGEERFWNPMVVTMTGGKTVLMQAPGIYTPKGTALVDLVRFYWQHPDEREELTDGRAVGRLQLA